MNQRPDYALCAETKCFCIVKYTFMFLEMQPKMIKQRKIIFYSSGILLRVFTISEYHFILWYISYQITAQLYKSVFSPLDFSDSTCSKCLTWSIFQYRYIEHLHLWIHIILLYIVCFLLSFFYITARMLYWFCWNQCL